MSSELATSVSYGFKAPITMVLVPMIQAFLYPTGFKYLHVVRDGRDVALSSNQSPLKKFYNFTYPDAPARLAKFRNMTPVLAMQLWNDWNADLLEWAERTQMDASSSNTTTTAGSCHFDYLVVRSEDFLNVDTKFQAMQRLADFVGSPLTNEELCCLSQKQARDMGQSGWYYKDNNTTTSKTTMTGQRSHTILPKRQSVDAIPSLDHRRLMVDQQQDRMSWGVRLLERGVKSNTLHEFQQRIPPGMVDTDAANRRKWIKDALFRNGAHRIAGGRSGVSGVSGGGSTVVTDHQDSPNWLSALMGKTKPNPIPLVPPPIVGRRRRNYKKLDYGDETLGELFATQLADLYVQQNMTKTNRNVAERYGKWSKLVDPNSSLSFFLHREGARALHIFGYDKDDASTIRSKFVADTPPLGPFGSCHGSNTACPP
jgi:hypothetical protein